MYQSRYSGQVIDSAVSLLKVKELTNSGYRLITSNPNNHGNIGDFAVDLSTQSAAGNHGAMGNYSVAINLNTTAQGFSSFAIGTETIAQNNSQFSLGYYNIGTSLNTVLELGIGNASTRANALEVYTNGSIYAPELTISLINNIRSLTTKEYVDSRISLVSSITDLSDVDTTTLPPAINQTLIWDGTNWVPGTDIYIPSELEKITETNQGWRILGRNPNNYGDIGQDAIDLSYSDSSSSTKGATGDISFSKGYNTTAQGDYSHAEGFGTIAINTAQHVQGRFNIGTANNTIYEIGIGLNAGSRANALEVYNDGRIYAPELTIAKQDNQRSLITREYLENSLSTLSGYIKSDGTIPMDIGYVPINNQDVVTKAYSDMVDGGSL